MGAGQWWVADHWSRAHLDDGTRGVSPGRRGVSVCGIGIATGAWPLRFGPKPLCKTCSKAEVKSRARST